MSFFVNQWQYVTAGAVAVAVLGQTCKPVNTALRLTLRFPLCFGLMWLAQTAPRAIPSTFPYNPDAIVAQVMKIAEDIRADPVNRERFANVVGPCNGWRRDAGLEFEPVKERTTVKLVLSYPQKDGTNLDIKIFCKCTGMRRISLPIRAIVGAFSWIPREIGFYAEIARGDGLVIPPTVVVPKMLLHRENVFVDRTLLVLETLPDRYETIPDFKGISFVQARVLMGRSARFHGANWNPRSRRGVMTFTNDGKGLEFINFVNMYKKDHPKKFFTSMWDAMEVHFNTKAKDLMAVVHGDCRPGNMLFRNDVWDKAPAAPSDEWFGKLPDDAVVFTDWEMVSVAPVLWDPAYTLVTGLRVADRRKHQTELFNLYLAELRKSAPESAQEALANTEELLVQLDLLMISIYWYGLCLSRVGCVGENHGNCSEDSDEWGARVRAAIIDVTADAPRLARILNVPEADVLQFRDEVLEAERVEAAKREKQAVTSAQSSS